MEEIRQKIADGFSKRSIAREMGINETTLRKRLKAGTIPSSLGRFKTDIPLDMEADLAQQVRDLDLRFYGITKKDLKIAAYKFAEANKLQHRFSNIKKMAVPNKLPKVLSSKGKKLVGKVASADRGQLVTAVCCFSVTGTYIPPAMILPRKRMKDELFLNAPTGTCKMISDSGFINKELFCQWLRHFKSYSKPSAENQVLLILDNHSSHRDLDAINFCRDNHIDLLSLPPHATHKMQPLDVGFFGPLKCAYSRECDKWMVSNPGKVITQMQVAGLFNQAYTSVANIGKSENSFRASGIYPYNPDQFNDDDFAPSCVTDALITTPDAPINTTDAPNYTENGQLNDEVVVEIDDPQPSTSIPIHATPPPLDIASLDIVCEKG
ncbi:uncharacterized protein LOC108914372, partial [Anoplophora glabripennis]|uniref:uncharacterized protein LOC108914372 n=1 Tax=Anoplophora glabripennis TaxID=217634 RepID=UPI000C7795BD